MFTVWDGSEQQQAHIFAAGVGMSLFPSGSAGYEKDSARPCGAGDGALSHLRLVSQAFQLRVRPALDDVESALDRTKMLIYKKFAEYGLPCPITGSDGHVISRNPRG